MDPGQLVWPVNKFERLAWNGDHALPLHGQLAWPEAEFGRLFRIIEHPYLRWNLADKF